MQKIIFNASKINHQAQVPLPLSQQNPKSKNIFQKNKLTILGRFLAMCAKVSQKINPLVSSNNRQISLRQLCISKQCLILIDF